MKTKIDKKTLKMVAQLATFITVSACITAALNKYAGPSEKTIEIATRIGKAVIWGGTVLVSVDSVGHLIDNLIKEDQKVEVA